MLFGLLSRGEVDKAVILLFFIILPLIYLPNIFNPYEFPKFMVFVVLVLFLILLNLIRFWSRCVLRNDGKKTPFVFKIDTLTKLVFSHGVVVYFADLFGIDPRTSFLGSEFRHQGFIALLAGIILFLVVRHNCHNHHKFYKNYITAILIGAFFVCIFALWQGIAFYVFHNFSIPIYQGRIVGTLGNPNSLAGYLAIILPLALWRKNKITCLALSIMIMIVIFLTQSRAAILAAGVVLLIWIILFIRRFVLWKKILAFAIGILLMIFIVQFLQGQRWQFNRNSIWDNRGLIWTEGIKAVSKRPILGYGQENFELVFPKERHMKVDNAHNIFLETAISAGIIGLILYIAIIYYFLKKTSRWDVRLSIIAFLIVGQFNPLSISQIALFWFLLGVASFKKDLLESKSEH